MSTRRLGEPRDRDDPRQLRAAGHDPQEVARFEREQPPSQVPRRSYAPIVPGLVALPVLGGRVIRRLQGED